MKTSRTLLFVLLAMCAGLATPAAAANSAYDLFIVACDNTACRRIAEQTVSSGLANFAEFNRKGLRLMIEVLAQRTNEEDTRVSLDIRPAEDGTGAWRATSASLAQRLEVFQCTLKHGTFSPLTSFISDGITFQIWARLAAR